MPLIVSYLILPLVLLLILGNVYFRIKIIKQYKLLRARNFEINPSDIFNKLKRQEIIDNASPEDAAQLNQFVNNLNGLLRFVALGCSLIFISFLYIYFTNGNA